MRAWLVNDPTDLSNGLEMLDIDEPDSPLVIRAHAAGIGYPDLLMRLGEFQIPQEPPFVLGWEAAGVVVQAPADAHVSVGDRVATISFGAFAELLAVDPNTTFAIPDDMTFAQGAALPLNYFTALAALRRGDIGAGTTVVVHGAAGGVGSAAVQLAKAVGAEVFAVVSTPAKADHARRNGADHVLQTADWLTDLRALCPFGVDAIIDPVGGERFKDSVRALGTEGRVVVIGFVGGAIPTVSVNKLLFNNVDVRGCSWSVLGGHPGGFITAAEELVDHFSAGRIAPEVTHVHDFVDLPLALETLERREATGKQVVAIAAA